MFPPPDQIIRNGFNPTAGLDGTPDIDCESDSPGQTVLTMISK